MARHTPKKRKNLVLRGEVWWFRKRVDGKVYRCSTGCKDSRQAERRATEIEKDINDGRFGWREEPKADVPTVAEWADKVLLNYVNTPKRFSADTRDLYARVLTRLRDSDLGSKRLDEVSEFACRTYLGSGSYARQSPNALRVVQSYCKALWNHARKDKLVTENPWCFKPPKRVLRKRVLLVAEQPLLLAALPDQFQRFVKVLLLTGLRNAELCGLKDDAVDFTQRAISVYGKGQKYRTVPLVPECAELLRAQMTARDGNQLGRLQPPQRRLIAEHHIFPVSTNTTAQQVKRAARRAKLAQRITVHDLRRTYATRCAMSGVPMKTLQEWLGHASINLTAEFYTQNLPTGADDLLASVRASVAPAPAAAETTNTKVVTFRRD